MSWETNATDLTYAKLPGEIGEEEYWSRVSDTLVDPRLNGRVHVVQEIIKKSDAAAHSNNPTNVGLRYLQYDMLTDAVVRFGYIEPVPTSGVKYRAGGLGFDLTTERLYCLYAVDGGLNIYTPGGANTVVMKQSSDGGGSWSTQETVATSATSFWNSSRMRNGVAVSFGYDGNAVVIFHEEEAANSELTAVHFNRDTSSWGNNTNVATFGATGGTGGRAVDVAVGPEGQAVAVCSYPDTSNTSRVKIFTYDPSTDTWTGGQTMQSRTAGGTRDVDFVKVEFNIARQEFDVFWHIYGTNVRYTSVDLNRVIGSPTDLSFGAGFGAAWNGWISAIGDPVGDLHVIQDVGTGNPVHKHIDRNTFTVTTTSLDYTASTPQAMQMSTSGEIITYANQLRVFCTSSVVTASDVKEDLWTFGDPDGVPLGAASMWNGHGKIVGLTSYEDVNVDQVAIDRRLVAYIGDTVYHDGGTNEFIGNSLGNLATEPVPDFATMEDNAGDNALFITDGGDNILNKWVLGDTAMAAVSNTWDGNNQSESPPKASIIESAKNRLWAVDPRYPRKLMFSGLRDGEAWSLTQASLDEDDPGFLFMQDLPWGEGITAVKELHGNRYVFSQNAIMEVSGDTPGVGGLSADINIPRFRTRKVVDGVGAVANRAVASIGTDLIFLSRKGVHSLLATEKFGDVDEKYLSWPIQDIFATFNEDLLERAQAVNYRRKNWYVVNVSRGTDGSKLKTLLIYDYSQNAWALWTFDFEITCLHTRVNPTTKREELLAGSDRGHVYLLDQGTRTDDDGATNYTGSFRSMHLHGGDPETYKKFTRLILHFAKPDVGTVTGNYWVDNHGPFPFTIDQNPYDQAMIGNFEIGTDTIGSGGDVTPVTRHVVVNKRGRTFVFKIDCTAGNMNVSGAEMQIVPGHPRKITK